MTQSYLCIFIPDELQQYTKAVTYVENNIETADKNNNFGVKLIKDESGNLKGTAYYSNSGELIKKIYYDGSSVSTIKYYRNNLLYSQEKFDTGKIIKKTLFDALGKEISKINYQYNRDNQIKCLQKLINNLMYSVEYGYDELKRVNSRRIKVNNKLINEQYYRYDILDRIVEYRDLNQCINIQKINQNNELVRYSITDVIGNRIIINNKFMCSEYIGTEIELNEHKTTIKDRSYVSNVMLKKPYTTEDDLDFALSNLLKIPKINPQSNFVTKREYFNNNDEIANYIISNKKDSECTPPVSADKIKNLRFK